MERKTLDFVLEEPVGSVLQERSINKFPSMAIFQNTISINRLSVLQSDWKRS
jgi:hypothetical protein